LPSARVKLPRLRANAWTWRPPALTTDARNDSRVQ
jgi:hypothetical protein